MPAPCKLTFDLLTYKMVYLCASFVLPRPLCSRLRPDVRDNVRQTERRQTRIVA